MGRRRGSRGPIHCPIRQQPERRVRRIQVRVAPRWRGRPIRDPRKGIIRTARPYRMPIEPISGFIEAILIPADLIVGLPLRILNCYEPIGPLLDLIPSLRLGVVDLMQVVRPVLDPMVESLYFAIGLPPIRELVVRAVRHALELLHMVLTAGAYAHAHPWTHMEQQRTYVHRDTCARMTCLHIIGHWA